MRFILVVLLLRMCDGRCSEEKKEKDGKVSAAIFSAANGASFPTTGLFAATEIIAGLPPGAGTHMESLLE